MTRNELPRRRRLKFVTGLAPGPTVICSERSFEELCEAYIAERRSQAGETRKTATDGSGSHASIPANPAPPDDNEPDAARPRRRPGVR